ncbi:hypothetical protein [Actinomadura sp. 3N407]|uniref:hypothetical protein n=1 Tax=Actinomadura sp. 3N407 TaxID=3457423 RepID=UPI003FCE2DD1
MGDRAGGIGGSARELRHPADVDAPVVAEPDVGLRVLPVQGLQAGQQLLAGGGDRFGELDGHLVPFPMGGSGAFIVASPIRTE